jgi:hypothetical protein
MGARWGLAVFGLALGVGICVLAAVVGEPILGLALFAIMAISAGLVLALNERKAPVAVPAQTGPERISLLTLLATAAIGFIAIVVAFLGFLWQTSQGGTGRQFAFVALAAGIGYLIVILWFRLRR